jgi:hypothetical protein
MLAIVLTAEQNNHNLSQICDFFLVRKFEVGVVLSGQGADHLLRNHTKLAECDLVYDISVPYNLMSNFQSGLYLANNPCIVVPADWQPQRQGIEDLIRLSQTQLDLHMIKSNNDHWPVLITRKGLKHVRALDDLLTLSDPRIRAETASQELLNAHYLASPQSGNTELDLNFTDQQKSL